MKSHELTTILGQDVVVMKESASSFSHPLVRFADTSLPQHLFEAKVAFYAASKPKPLPPERKAAWLTRLRNPDEHQAKGYLCGVTVDGTKERCCLGIYAEVCDIPSREISISSHYYQQVLSFEFPNSYYDEVEPDKSLLAGDLKDEVESASFLADLNDSGWSFLEIADLIEKVY